MSQLLLSIIEARRVQYYTRIGRASELGYTLLPIGVFLRGLKVDGCLLSLQSTILLCIYVTNFPRALVGPR